ncbi:MAG: hypothetical protein ACRC5Q_02485 [Culicoidibacterales bacterium]
MSTLENKNLTGMQKILEAKKQSQPKTHNAIKTPTKSMGNPSRSRKRYQKSGMFDQS